MCWDQLARIPSTFLSIPMTIMIIGFNGNHILYLIVFSTYSFRDQYRHSDDDRGATCAAVFTECLEEVRKKN